jgi:hypothetical protein
MSQISAYRKPFTEKCIAQACEVLNAYLKETVKRQELEKQLEIMKAEIESYQEAIELILSGVRELIQPDHASLAMLKKRLQRMNNIYGLYYFVREDVIYLWILTNKEDVETEITICEELANLFSTFKDMRFDFVIGPLNEMKPEDVLPSNVKRVL